MTARSRFIAASTSVAGALATIAALGFAVGGDAHLFKPGTWCAYVLCAMACAAAAAGLATRRGLGAWRGRSFAMAAAVVSTAYAGFLAGAFVVTTIDHALVFTDVAQLVRPNYENVAFVMFFLTCFTACAGLLPALAFEYLLCRKALRRETARGAAS